MRKLLQVSRGDAQPVAIRHIAARTISVVNFFMVFYFFYLIKY